MVQTAGAGILTKRTMVARHRGRFATQCKCLLKTSLNRIEVVQVLREYGSATCVMEGFKLQAAQGTRSMTSAASAMA